MSFFTEAKVIKHEQVIPGQYRLTFAAPAIAGQARPGQFLHVRCGVTYDPLLRRPISIHTVDRREGWVTLLYRVAGRGTALLAERKEGDTVSIIGPLGRGFTMPEDGAEVFAVSGGIGIAPLYFLLQELAGKGIKATVFQGAATAKQVFLENGIKELGHNVLIATDDGSRGFHGSVTGLFVYYLQSNGISPRPETVGHSNNIGQLVSKGLQKTRGRQEANGARSASRVYACGPHGMLKKLSEITARRGIPCEVSLEERMGCGVGACLSCACKIKTSDGKTAYHRVCLEGPVFPSGEVCWE